MDITTLIGMITAIIGLLGGMYFKGVAYSNLANPAAIFIILVGTAGAVITAFPKKDIVKVGAIFGKVFTDKSSGMSATEIIDLILKLSQITRKEGLLSLESSLAEIDSPFLKRGLSFVIDGATREFIEDTLEEDIAAMEERHAGNSSIFTQAGTYAPTLGVLGAVVGLIAALGNMEDTHALGHAISGAFMATVFGIYTGYVLWHPFANKLKRKSKEESIKKYIMLQGILLIYEGMNTNLIQERLLCYLSDKEKDTYIESKTSKEE